jgi:hypothetical protein
MAKLFKEKIIKQRLENFEIVDMHAKLETLSSWYKVSQTGNLKEKSEKEVEQSFAEHILGSVLGYTAYGSDDIYTREAQPKAESTWQKADFWLGFFDATGKENSLLKVVMEVKDARTPLDKPQQREGSLTPVQQGFKYKPFFKSCDFVIVSNFIETRLFYDNYSDYEVWTLTDLVNPKYNYYNFRKFYFLLCRENLIARRGESTTKKLLSDIRIEQESITKKFYKDYSELRKELYRDLLRNNADENKKVSKEKAVLLLEKAQKIIDRLIFIHFCEDLDLLPQWKLKENVLRAEEIGFSPWEMLKKFFEFVNSGSKNLGIPEGYNGGLFHADFELDSLKVGDDICKKFIDLGRYDFEDDLSVNILGHIFEQSISDIEELKEKIQLDAWLDTKISKRKKDGIFYTPEYIVDYIVKNSVGKKIEDWENELKQLHNFREDLTDKHYEKRAILIYEALLEKVQQIKVLDPACGSGAFLVKVFDFLLAKNKEIAEKIREFKGEKNLGLFQSDSHFKSILQNNIYGVDLNDESVEITKLSLWLKTASKGKKLANLDANIKCGNSLIDDPAVAWDKAFSWEKEFSEIFTDGGFDVIVGNPPYVSYYWKYAQSISEEEMQYYLKLNTFYWIKTKNISFNLIMWFFDRYHWLIKNKWIVWVIVDQAFSEVEVYSHTRDFINKNFRLSTLIKNILFPWVVADTAIIIMNKDICENYDFTFWKIDLDKDLININSRSLKNDSWNFSINGILLEKIENTSILLSSYCETFTWMQIIPEYFLSNDISVLSSPKWHKAVFSSNIEKYAINYPVFWQAGLYITYDNDLQEKIRKELQLKIDSWEKWVRTPASLSIGSKDKEYRFDAPKIIISQTVSNKWWKIRLQACIDDKEWYYWNVSIHIVKSDNIDKLKYITTILNSKLISFYWINKGIILGAEENSKKTPQIRKKGIDILPIKNIPLPEQTPFIEKADFMLEHNKLLQEKAGKFLGRVSWTFDIVKLSRKLENFWELSFAEFVKELEKLKVKLSLKDQDEWEEYFESYKKEVSELKSQIDAYDKQIDEMVFDLYGLTQEEREVVLKS